MSLAHRHAAQVSSVRGEPFQVTGGSSRQGSGWPFESLGRLRPLSFLRLAVVQAAPAAWGPYKSIHCLCPFGTGSAVT